MKNYTYFKIDRKNEHQLIQFYEEQKVYFAEENFEDILSYFRRGNNIVYKKDNFISLTNEKQVLKDFEEILNPYNTEEKMEEEKREISTTTNLETVKQLMEILNVTIDNKTLEDVVMIVELQQKHGETVPVKEIFELQLKINE